MKNKPKLYTIEHIMKAWDVIVQTDIPLTVDESKISILFKSFKNILNIEHRRSLKIKEIDEKGKTL